MRLGPASSKVSCDRRSELSHPAAHRLIGHHDAALSQQVLDIPEAEDKPGIEPDGLLNNRGWEAISGVADFAHDRHLWPQISAGKRNNVTMPWLAPPGQKADKALTSVSLSEQGLVQVLEAAVTRLEPGKPYVLALANEASGGGTLQPLQSFMTNPAGSAVVTAIGPIRHLVRGDDKVQRRYLVIAPGMVDGPGAPVQVQAE
jgi:hypothetical protein